MSTAAILEYPAGVILLSFPLTLYTLALPFAKRYCERVSQSILFPQRHKKTTTNGRAEIELVSDAWPRFEKFIREIVKTGPQHRAPTTKPKAKAAPKATKETWPLSLVFDSWGSAHETFAWPGASLDMRRGSNYELCMRQEI